MKIDKFFCNFLMSLILVYNAQGYFYDDGSFLSRTSLLIWLIISLGYALKFVYHKEKDKLGKVLFLFWLINAIYWLLSPKIIFSSMIGSVFTTNMFKNITISILTYFPFFYFFRHKSLNSNKLVLFIVLLFIVFFFQYKFNSSFERFNADSEDIINNSGYAFVFLFPLLCLFLNRKFFFYTLYCISLILIILGNKRGAILTFSLQSIIMVFFLLKSSASKQNILKWTITLSALIIIAYVASKAYIQNDYLHYRISQAQEGSFSGRSEIYNLLWNRCINGNFINLIFGYGFAQSVSLAGITAHNDWLEILSGQGMLGIVVFFLFFYVIIKNYLLNKILMDNTLKMMYLSSLVAMLSTSFFSAGYNSLTYYLLLIPITYVNYQIKR